MGIRNLRFPDSVERQLVEQWRTTWMQRAEEESRNIERLNAEARLVGQDTAVKEFATASGQLLAMALQHLPEEHESLEGEQMGPNMPESLRLLLQGTLKLCIREPLLQSRMSNQMNNLLEIIEWIRKR
ncbi:MAG: hypothetical protein EHM70_22650 [Chloroflexota bacterium]|nr:MAG: hypothetical protein EHM70_22650 [Chloroflexota bacterium]